MSRIKEVLKAERIIQTWLRKNVRFYDTNNEYLRNGLHPILQYLCVIPDIFRSFVKELSVKKTHFE